MEGNMTSGANSVPMTQVVAGYSPQVVPVAAPQAMPQAMPQMVPVYSNVAQQPAQYTTQASPQQGYQSQPYQGYNPAQESLQLANRVLEVLSRSGANQYQPQVAPSYPTAQPPVLAPYQGYQTQAYQTQAYPTTSQPTQGLQSNYMGQPQTNLPAPLAEALDEVGSRDFASVQKILRAFGGDVGTALETLNVYACQVEDQLDYAVTEYQKLYGQMQQILPIAEGLQSKGQQMEDLLTDPENLAQWYLELEKIHGNEPGQVQPQAQPQNQLPQGYGMNPALAANYMQQAQTGVAPQGLPQAQFQRPEFPVIPGSATQGQPIDLNSVPPSERYKYIDQAARMGGFKGARIQF